MLSEGSTEGINDSTNAAKKTSISFSKAKTKFFLSLHYKSNENYLFLKKRLVSEEIFRFKANNNISL